MRKNLGTGVVEPIAGAEIDAVDAALGELEIADAGHTDTITELDASEDSVIEALEMRDAAVADQPVSEHGIAEAKPEATGEAETTKSKTKKAKKSGEPRKPRAPRDINTLAPETFVLFSDETPADLDANKASVIASRPTQKKIAEKFDNLFQSIAAGKQPSVYVMACFNVLNEKGSATSGELVAALQATSRKKGGNYSEGTARSQAGQMMVLFSTVGIAERVKQTLTLNDNSALVNKLRSLATAPLAAAA